MPCRVARFGILARFMRGVEEPRRDEPSEPTVVAEPTRRSRPPLTEGPSGRLSPGAEPDELRYVATTTLGAGGTSIVVAAHDRDLGREVAIKLVDLSASAALAQAFAREAQTTASLEHPNIVPIYDAGRWGQNHLFLSMRKIVGESLGARIRAAIAGGDSQLMPINDLINVISKVCDALAFAHDRGVVHQDVKPDNILLGRFGEVMVVDWGAASRTVRQEETKIVGTPSYMSPEQARGEDVGPKSDLYSLASTFFYALFLRKASPNAETETFWLDKMSGRIVPPTAHELASRPGPLVDILMRALSPDPEDRQASIAEFARELSDFQAGHYAWSGAFSHEAFDDGWWRRWIPAEEGSFEVVDGRAISKAAHAAFLVYHQRLPASVAVEYEAESLAGCAPGDLSVIWSERDVLGADAIDVLGPGPKQRVMDIGSRIFGLQVGAYDNLCTGIFSHAKYCVVASALRITPGRRYTIRAEIEERELRLYVDAKLVASYEDTFPFTTGYLALYAYHPGKCFGNVRLFSKGLSEKVSPVVIGDAFYAEGRYDRALFHYRRVAEVFRGKPLGDEAEYKHGLCLHRLGDVNTAFTHWKSISHPTWRGIVELHRLDAHFTRGDHESARVLFGELHANNPGLRQRLRERWATFVNDLSEIHPLANRSYVTVRDELFPDDMGTIFAAAHAVRRLARYEEVVERFPEIGFEVIAALGALGRDDELLERYGTIPWVRAGVLLQRGEMDGLTETDRLEPGVRFALGDLDTPAETVGSAETLLAAGRYDDVLEYEQATPHQRALALWRLGRFEEAAAEPCMIGKLVGAPDQAREFIRRVREQRYYLLHETLRTYIVHAGEHESVRERYIASPFSFRWDNVWLGMFVLEPFLRWHAGDRKALTDSLESVLVHQKRHFAQKAWYFAAGVLGRVSESQFAAQPLRAWVESRWALASALKAELVGDRTTALAAYRRFGELAPRERNLDSWQGDLVAERFIDWRLSELGARS